MSPNNSTWAPPVSELQDFRMLLFEQCLHMFSSSIWRSKTHKTSRWPSISSGLHLLFRPCRPHSPQKTRELDVMRVWLLRAFVVLFLDFVMFSQSFHSYNLNMFLCSCFLNKTNFSCLKNLWIQLYPSLPISILIVSKVALFGLLPPHSL